MINLNLLPLLATCFEDVRPGGRILTLGRQTLGFTREALGTAAAAGAFGRSVEITDSDAPLHQEEVLGLFGFTEVDSLDVSSYEGATFVHDLNAPTPPENLIGRYRVVFTGGTLEHCYHFPNALRTATALLEPGGLLVHLGPMNNWIDHGFYQFSPTLWFDLARANNWTMRCSFVVERVNADGAMRFRVGPLYPGEGAFEAGEGRLLQVVSIQIPDSGANPLVPKQGLYLDKHGDATAAHIVRSFGACVIEDGILTPSERQTYMIAGKRLERTADGTWHVRVEPLGGNRNRPFRGHGQLLEDGTALRYIASGPELVARTPGSFCHIGYRVHFSTSDGTDPTTNGRQYAISVPTNP
jgi:hypothetical protein